MNKKIKLLLAVFYIAILVLFLYFIFSKLEINRLNDFIYYKELQKNIENFIFDKLFYNILLFSLFSIIWISLLGFGSPLLIVSGIFFGKWTGTLVSVVSIATGALILYSIASFFFKDLVHSILKRKFSKYINLFKKNEFYYFFIFRFVGGLGIPFGLQNILPVIFNMGKFNYFLSSVLGFIPSFFVWNTIGSGLNEYIEKSDSFSFVDLILSKEIFLPILLFIFLILSSLIIKKKIFDAQNN
tara:strand:+ start:163 stop:888 length:726 start_codon:yes stop_codon:yes gene_type:complete